MNAEQLESAKKALFIALGIDLTISVLLILNFFSTIGALHEIQSGTRVLDQALVSSIESWSNFAKLTILSFIGVCITLVRWLNACYRNANESIHASGFQNEKWTAACWVVPFINLYKPYQIISELYKAGTVGYSTPDAWKKERGSGLLLTWWIGWVLIHWFMLIFTKQILIRPSEDGLTLQQIINNFQVQILVCIASVIISVLWFVVANHLTQRLLLRKSAEIQPSADNHSSTQEQSVSRPQNEATLLSPATDIEDRFFSEVAKELLAGKRDEGLWAKAYSLKDGDEKTTKAYYIRLRVAQLSRESLISPSAVEREPANHQESPTAHNSPEKWSAAFGIGIVVVGILAAIVITASPPPSVLPPESSSPTEPTNQPSNQVGQTAPHEQTESVVYAKQPTPESQPQQNNQTLDQAEQLRVNAVAEEMIKKYPMLDSSSASTNPEAIGRVISFRNYYISSEGLSPADALRKAAEEVGQRFVPGPKGTLIDRSLGNSKAQGKAPRQQFTRDEMNSQKQNCVIDDVMTDEQIQRCRNR